MMLDIKEFTTFYKVHKVDEIDYSKLKLRLMTKNFRNEYTDYAFKEYKNLIAIPKIPVKKLSSYLGGVNLNITQMPHARVTKCKYKMINKPKDDIQAKVIEKVVDSFTKESQTIVTLQTGQGKTYIATNIISKLKVRAFIFVQRDTLRSQWYQSFINHTDCKNVHILKGTNDLVLLENGAYEGDVFITTHATVRNYITQHGVMKFNFILSKLGIGIKVYDEFDMETKSMYFLDTHTNIKYTLYLSATDYKSSVHDQKVFERVFNHVPNIGKEYAIKVERNTHIFIYNSNPTQKEYNSCYRWMWQLQERKFDKQSFHKYQIEKLDYLHILDIIWDTYIKERLKKKLKVVFFIGRIDPAIKFRELLSERYNININEIGIFNSSISKKDKEKEKLKDIIISTSQSLGRGIDMERLDTVIDMETRSSKSEFAQVVGRVSRTGGTVGTYILIVDKTFQEVFNNYRNKKYKDFFTSIKVTDLSDKGE